MKKTKFTFTQTSWCLGSNWLKRIYPLVAFVMLGWSTHSFAQTEPPNCADIYPTIDGDGVVHLDLDDLLTNGDVTRVEPATAQVFNEWGAPIRIYQTHSLDVAVSTAGDRSGTIHDFDPDGGFYFNACSLLGKTLTFKVTNSIGSCQGKIYLNGLPPVVLSSAFTPSRRAIDFGLPTAIIEQNKITTYCGYVPNPNSHRPNAFAPCGNNYHGLAVQPDWIMPIRCSENNDTAEVILRTWEVFNKEGEITLLTDTIVVLRLPALLPGNFIGYKEDSVYCEIIDLPQEGEVITRYSAWKQPMGLHDYELPHDKMGAVTYKIPTSVLLNNYSIANDNGLLNEFLNVVLLKKRNSQREYTIGDIVTRRYENDLRRYTTSEQQEYGLLHNITHVVDIASEQLILGPYTFIPILFLEIGDYVLSSNGEYVEVTEEWFWNYHGNNPYWMAAALPSLLGVSDCINYCDYAEVSPYSCVRVIVPALNVNDANNVVGVPSGCVTICLDNLMDNPHCGISVESKGTDWTSSGSCSQSLGVDIWIKQTCYATVSENGYTQSGDAALTGFNGASTTAPGTILVSEHCIWSEAEEAILNDNFIVVNATSSIAYASDENHFSRKEKIHLSQWVTLMDTIGPIFDFCYPTIIPEIEPGSDCNQRYCEIGSWNHEDRYIALEGNTLYPPGTIILHEEYTTLSSGLKATFGHYPSEIEFDIRAGRQYNSAEDYEYCYSTLYMTDSHDCAADVFVPSVTVKDVCSGVNSVKAMVNGRVFTLDRISTTKDGYVTYAHIKNPIRVPFSGHGVKTPVYYEASDSCWNQSRWTKYIEVKDATPPTAHVDDDRQITLSSKESWENATSFDEGSWDNCGIDLILARRTDWWADTACVNLCPEGKVYSDWSTLLNDLGFRSFGSALAGQNLCGDYGFDITALKKFLNSTSVENHYYQKLVWLWEDSYACGEFIVHGWIYDIVRYILLNDNCSEPDKEHGNRLKIEDFERFLDGIKGRPGYGKEVAQLGGGWSPKVPFKCEDACESPNVELLAVDYWCNWSKSGVVNVKIIDNSKAKVHKKLENVTISCEAYNVNYKEIVEAAAAYGAGGSTVDSTGAFKALDKAFGYYLPAWITNNGVATDREGNVITEEDCAFEIYTMACDETKEVTKVADTLHDGLIDWVNVVTTTTTLVPDTLDHSLGILGVLCNSRGGHQDIWVDLDPCGNGKITRRFNIGGSCSSDAKDGFTLTQVIYIKSACKVKPSMFDLPKHDYTKSNPACVSSIDPSVVSSELSTEIAGKLVVKPKLIGAICNSIGISSPQDKILEIVSGSSADGPKMYKLIRTWSVADWCNHDSKFEYEQEIPFIVDPSCVPDNGGNGDVSLAGIILTEDKREVGQVQVKAILGSGSPLTAVTTANGKYGFNVASGGKVSIVPTKDIGHGNGISTQDVIALQAHVLNKHNIKGPYRLIAANVHLGDKEDEKDVINGQDVLELRLMVLSPSRKFKDNTSWRFFVDDNTMAEQFDVFNLTKDQKVNFVGVKVGDIIVGKDSDASRSASSGLILNMNDQTLNPGTTTKIDVTAENFKDIMGMQYTLSYDDQKVEIKNIKGKKLNITSDHYTMIKPGEITTSWSEGFEQSFSPNDVLFTIELISKSEVQLSDVISMSDRIIRKEAYANDLSATPLNLQFKGKSNEFSLYQNSPNPYKGQTSVGFNLPQKSLVTLTVYDITGKVLKVLDGEYDKGYNEVLIKSADLNASGVLYYQLDTEKYTATKKMIVIE